MTAIETLGTALDTWLTNARLADSTRATRKHIIDRGILPVFRNRLLTEIQPQDLQALCNKVKERGALATAVQILMPRRHDDSRRDIPPSGRIWGTGALAIAMHRMVQELDKPVEMTHFDGQQAKSGWTRCPTLVLV